MSKQIPTESTFLSLQPRAQTHPCALALSGSGPVWARGRIHICWCTLGPTFSSICVWIALPPTAQHLLLHILWAQQVPTGGWRVGIRLGARGLGKLWWDFLQCLTSKLCKEESKRNLGSLAQGLLADHVI